MSARRALAARAQYLGVRVAARLPDRVKVRLSGEPPVVLDGQCLDPQVQLLRSLRRRRGVHGLVEPTVDIGRARFRAETAFFRGPVTGIGRARLIEAPGPGGPILLRHYVPEGPAQPLPLTVYLHGGGFVIGDLDTHDEPCRMLCRFGRMHVLSVQYRLAPEHPFPAGLEDACAALRWARANAKSLGADPSRVALGGDSAGANLAAVASALATREGSPPLAQLLIYPPTDATTTRPSHDLFGEGFFLTQRDREAFIHAYVGGDPSTLGDARVSPLRAADLSGLPPALVVTAGFDLLRDEGEAYAQALAAAGVRVRARRFDSLGHGFIHLTGVCPGARRAMLETARAWRQLDRLDRSASMTDTVRGAVVFITGPARGIGAELARVLAGRGARLALVGLEPARLQALAAELGSAHAWFECDVTDQAALARAADGAVAALGGIDVVVANAGIASHGTVAVTPVEAMARVIEVNLIGVLRTVSATLPHVTARKGYCLLISSAAALAAMPGLAAYAAAKSGVEQFANALRLEVAHKGVAVGSAHPCWIDTDLVRDARHDLGAFDRLLQRLPGPFGTVTSVQECAAALLRGIEGRKRKVFVPRSLAFFSAIRQLLSSPLGESVLRRDARRLLPEMESEVATLGRSFGEHSVETSSTPRSVSSG